MTTQWLLVGMAFLISVLLAEQSFRAHNQSLALIVSLSLVCAILLLPESLSINVFVLLFYGFSVCLYSRLRRVVYAFMTFVLLIMLSLLMSHLMTEQWLWVGICLASCVVVAAQLIQSETHYLPWCMSILLVSVLMLIVPVLSDNLFLAAILTSLQLYFLLKLTGIISHSKTVPNVTEIQAAERSRIYQNIHDDVGAELLRLIYALDNSEQKRQVKDIMQRLRRAVAQTTQISMDVRQLCDDIVDVCRQRLTEANIRFQSESFVDYNHVFRNTHPTTLLRMMNELLSNIIRHSKAQNVQLTVRSDKQMLSIHLSDDGCGLPLKMNAQSGRGLRGLQKRAVEISAFIKWQNNPDTGLSTTLDYPWP